MSVSTSANLDMSGGTGDGPFGSSRKCSKSGQWSKFNIAAMVIGFVLCWPVGLFILFWIISGRHVKEIPSAAQSLWSSLFGGSGMAAKSSSDNSIFNEFQQTQYDRIHEIKEEIKDRAKRFSDFKSDAKRRADEAEFKDFMANRADMTPDKSEN